MAEPPNSFLSQLLSSEATRHAPSFLTKMAALLPVLLAHLLLLCAHGATASAAATPPPLPILPVPSYAQLRWQLSEMALFLHFGPNTFTDSEWGDRKSVV